MAGPKHVLMEDVVCKVESKRHNGWLWLIVDAYRHDLYLTCSVFRIIKWGIGNVSNLPSKFDIRSWLLGEGLICRTCHKYPVYLVIVRVVDYKTQVLDGVVSMRYKCICSSDPRYQCHLLILLFFQFVFMPTICIFLWEPVLSLSLYGVSFECQVSRQSLLREQVLVNIMEFRKASKFFKTDLQAKLTVELASSTFCDFSIYSCQDIDHSRIRFFSHLIPFWFT